MAQGQRAGTEHYEEIGDYDYNNPNDTSNFCPGLQVRGEKSSVLSCKWKSLSCTPSLLFPTWRKAVGNSESGGGVWLPALPPQASGNGAKLRKQPKPWPALPQALYVEREWSYSNKPVNVFSVCKALILAILGFQRKILLAFRS